jgi:hypothetical protein
MKNLRVWKRDCTDLFVAGSWVYAVILTFLASRTFVEKAACQKFAKNPGKPIQVQRARSQLFF